MGKGGGLSDGATSDLPGLAGLLACWWGQEPEPGLAFSLPTRSTQPPGLPQVAPEPVAKQDRRSCQRLFLGRARGQLRAGPRSATMLSHQSLTRRVSLSSLILLGPHPHPAGVQSRE